MKEEILSYLRVKKEASIDELAQGLGKEKAKDFRNLVKTISEMERKRQLTFSNAGKIQLRKEKQMLTFKGTFHAHKNGFGFVTLNEEEDDLFIGRNDVNYAIDGDTAEVAITKVADRSKGTSAEAKVIDVLEHSLKTAVGQLILDEEKPKYAGYIRSKNQKISQPIYIKKPALVLDGTEILKVEIDKYPTKKHDFFVANVLDVVGHKDDPGIDVLEVLESMDIVSEFPERGLKEASAIPDMPSKKDFEGRLDLRNEITFTIDGADAKDLDDAVHIKKLKNGHFELGVHIADVSYYVKEGSELDKEALHRATSVYVTDRVIPMLPERLSNGICSLNPNVDRLTQSAIMEIDQKGQVVKHTITQTIIKTTFRMTYSDVNDMIAGDEEKRAAFKAILPSVEAMVELHTILERMRYKRGALNFDTKEAKILVNKTGRPVDIILRQRGLAERMIESFMLVANETVAEHFATLNLPFIYRIHFTSPIRRYPDLLVHRMVRDYGRSKKIAEHFEQVIPDIASQSSSRERRAIEAEREVEAMKKAEFMEEFVGEEFDGIVSSVVKFGLFVELPNTVEGLIHVTKLPEFFHYNERNLTLQGEKSGVVFRVGQQIHIKLVRADKATGEIDFEYLPSEYDVIEKRKQSNRDRRQQSHQDNRGRRDKSPKGKVPRDKKLKKNKGKKPFYKEVVKKGSKNGKGRRKGRSAK